MRSKPDNTMNLNRTVYFLAALLALCLALSYQMAQPFLGPAMLALLFAIAFHPLHLWIARFGFFHHRESLAALLATLLIYFLVLLPLGTAVALLSDDVVAQVAAINNASKTEGGLTPLLTTKAHAVVAWIAPRLRLSEDYVLSQITSRAQTATQAALGWLGGFVVSAGSSLVDFIEPGPFAVGASTKMVLYFIGCQIFTTTFPMVLPDWSSRTALGSSSKLSTWPTRGLPMSSSRISCTYWCSRCQTSG